MPSPLLTLLRFAPQHLLSRLAGRAMSTRFPPPLRRALIGGFARVYGIDRGEVPGGVQAYASIQEFFTRPLAPGARPIDPAPDALVAPCDGAWGACGSVRDGTLLQVKGRTYSLAALLGSGADAGVYEGGTYATFYLAPRNYHRFHAPCTGEVVKLRYLPGALWPVNRVGLEGVDSLFAQNERLCAFVAGSDRCPPLCLVAVGATMVGKVRVVFDDLTTNGGGRTPVERVYGAPRPRLVKGEEWGRFEFGSTIILVVPPRVAEVDCRDPGSELRLGERVGTLA